MEILVYLFMALPFVIAFLVALGLCLLMVLFMNSPAVAMGFMAVTFLFETSLLKPFAMNFGIWLYAPDLLTILLCPAFFYRLLWLKKFNAIPRPWWLLGGVWMLLFVWGLAKFGTGAGVDFRPFFYLWLGAAYLSTFDYDEAFARRFLKFFVFMGLGVCAIAYYRWTMGAIDYQFHRELELLDTTGVAFLRVVPASAAFVVTCALFVVAHQAVTERASHMAWPLAILFGISIIVMQHRSVWMAAISGFVALALALQQLRAGAGTKLFSMVLASMVVLVLIVASGRFQGAVNSVEDQAQRATSTTSGTFVGRVEGWDSLLKSWAKSGSIPTYLVGEPFGGGYTRYTSEIGGEKIGYIPHNYYVQLLYRGGLVGLFAFLWTFVKGIRAIWSRLQSTEDALAPLLFAMVTAVLVYCIPYGIEYTQMLLIGLMLGMITQAHKTASATVSAQTGSGARLKPVIRAVRSLPQHQPE